MGAKVVFFFNNPLMCRIQKSDCTGTVVNYTGSYTCFRLIMYSGDHIIGCREQDCLLLNPVVMYLMWRSA